MLKYNSSSSKWVNGTISSVISYSTSEQDTGLTWVDGRKIYQKSIAITLPTTSTDGTSVTVDYAIGASVKYLVSLNVTVENNGRFLCLYDAVPNTSSVSIFARAVVYNNSYTTSSQKNTIKLSNGCKSWSGATGYATIQYTKA